MKREWKPGDVAMVTFETVAGPETAVGLCYHGGIVLRGGTSDGQARWSLPDHTEVWSSVTSAHPLVVIDPAGSAEDLDRLRYMLIYSGWVPTKDADALDDILREFANLTPPKPDEPLGLGAVVEDADGIKWLRMTGLPHTANTPWASGNKDLVRYDRAYADIDVVKVLSPGVTS